MGGSSCSVAHSLKSFPVNTVNNNDIRITMRTLQRNSHAIEYSKNQEGAITQEHVDIMAMCCKSYSSFLIFAVLVVWR